MTTLSNQHNRTQQPAGYNLVIVLTS